MAVALSVIIPTFNRADTLARCLDAFAQQGDVTARCEFLVVDDGSTDLTKAVAEAPRGLALRYLRQANGGANAARNRGLALAEGPLLLFINDDTLPTPGFLHTHLSVHAAHPDPEVAVLGRMTIHPEFAANPFSPLHHDASFAPLAAGAEVPWTAFFTCNVSLKADFIRQEGGFDESLRWHEDIELGERLSRRGLRLLYHPEALGLHWHALDEGQLLRIAEREGAALVEWWRKRPDLIAELADLGLVGPPGMPAAARHRLSDAAFSLLGEGSALALARWLAPRRPEAARAVWRRVFQHRKRRAIRRAMPAAAEGGSAPTPVTVAGGTAL